MAFLFGKKKEEEAQTSAASDLRASVYADEQNRKQKEAEGAATKSFLREQIESLDDRPDKTITIGKDPKTGEPLLWLPIKQDDGKLLVISKEPVAFRKYHDFAEDDCNWEISSVRKWLNSTFRLGAFTEIEREVIVNSKVPNDDISGTGTIFTTDNLFLLTIQEVEKYFPNALRRKVRQANGTTIYWWTRNKGFRGDLTAIVGDDGVIDTFGCNIGKADGAVRPAMWLQIPKDFD